MTKDEFTRTWILRHSLEELPNYENGVLTIRSLYYRLVGRGLTNSQRHYKRVVSAMIYARREGLVQYEKFSDNDREMIGTTQADETLLDNKVHEAKQQIRLWMKSYHKNRWENQPIYPEVLIEKKALQGVFQPICRRHRVALGACKGYPSLTFLNDVAQRFNEARGEGKQCVILYFGDYDPSGEDIPRSIEANLRDDFRCPVEVRRVALHELQIRKWNLPPAPAKDTDSRTANWDGIGQVELDAVSPKHLQEMLNSAIESVFDQRLGALLDSKEEEEREEFVITLKDYVLNMNDDDE